MAAEKIDESIFRIVAERNGLHKPYAEMSIYSIQLEDDLACYVLSLCYGYFELQTKDFISKKIRYNDFSSNVDLIFALERYKEMHPPKYLNEFNKIYSTIIEYYEKVESLKVFR